MKETSKTSKFILEQAMSEAMAQLEPTNLATGEIKRTLEINNSGHQHGYKALQHYNIARKAIIKFRHLI